MILITLSWFAFLSELLNYIEFEIHADVYSRTDRVQRCAVHSEFMIERVCAVLEYTCTNCTLYVQRNSWVQKNRWILKLISVYFKI